VLHRDLTAADGLDAVSVSHLVLIARVATRLSETEASWALPIVLARVTTDVGVATRVLHQHRQEFLATVNEMIAVRADAVAQRAAASVVGRLPDGCFVNLGALRPAAVAALRQQVGEELVVRSLISVIGAQRRVMVTGIDAWIEKESSRLLESLRPELAPYVPPGLSLDERKCAALMNQALDETFLKDIAPARWFLDAFRRDPDAFVAGIEDWYTETATRIFESVRPELETDLPPGCTVRRDACVGVLVKFLRKRTPPERILEAFASEVRADVQTYVAGLREILESRAQEILPQIEAEFREVLPPQCSLRTKACIDLLVRLMGESVGAENLLKAFVDALSSSPHVYISGLPSYSTQPSSDAPYRSQSSGARLATGR
jgi:hypothetical protein